MTDPRAGNCIGYLTDASGKVTGVELVVREIPSAPYALHSVALIDEASAGGNTVASCLVLDAAGIPLAENVWLAWPWPGPPWDDMSLPGNPHGQHMITNGYDPALGLGPLALYVGDADGNPLSDIVAGLGLPYNRHVSYRATWVTRTVGQPDTGPVDAGTEALERIADALERIDVTLQLFTEHMGVNP